MDLKLREIKFIETHSGRVPFDDWYRTLKDRKTRRIIAGKLKQLQNVDFRNYKAISDGVYELRIFHGPGYRIYFGLDNKHVVVLILGGDKSTQKRDIIRAITLWKEYKCL